jgi:hypothetical protein
MRLATVFWATAQQPATLNKDNMDQVWGYDGKVIPW